MSTCEAEYVALSEVCQEVMGLNNSLKLILNENLLPLTLWCDNIAAEINAKTSGSNKLRHVIDIKNHYVRQCINMNLVQVKWVASKYQLADIFTKPLAFDLHARLKNTILNIL